MIRSEIHLYNVGVEKQWGWVGRVIKVQNPLEGDHVCPREW